MVRTVKIIKLTTMANWKGIVGQSFTPEGYKPPELIQFRSVKYGYQWKSLYVCYCGKVFLSFPYQVKNGFAKTCGCLKKSGMAVKMLNTTHGLSKHRLHGIWSGMTKRCYNPNSTKFYVYGGRGIRVCQEWLDDFKCFYDWAMGNGYGDHLSIDRIDNNGHYEPSNCRWADSFQQANNKSKNVFIIWMDIRQTIAQWAKGFKLPPTTFRRWYYESGCDMEIIIEKIKQAA